MKSEQLYLDGALLETVNERSTGIGGWNYESRVFRIRLSHNLHVTKINEQVTVAMVRTQSLGGSKPAENELILDNDHSLPLVRELLVHRQLKLPRLKSDYGLLVKNDQCTRISMNTEIGDI